MYTHDLSEDSLDTLLAEFYNKAQQEGCVQTLYHRIKKLNEKEHYYHINGHFFAK